METSVPTIKPDEPLHIVHGHQDQQQASFQPLPLEYSQNAPDGIMLVKREPNLERITVNREHNHEQRTVIIETPISQLPTRLSVRATGLDLYMAKTTRIQVLDSVWISTGISIHPPSQTFGQLIPRSSAEPLDWNRNHRRRLQGQNQDPYY